MCKFTQVVEIMRHGEPSQCEGELGTPSDVGGMGAALSFRVLEGTGHAKQPSVPQA